MPESHRKMIHSFINEKETNTPPQTGLKWSMCNQDGVPNLAWQSKKEPVHISHYTYLCILYRVQE